MCRRVDGATGEDHLVGAQFLRAALDQRFDADAARRLEQQLGDLSFCRDLEIGTLAHVAVQIADRGRDALLVGVRVCQGEVTVLELAVLVRQIRHARRLEGLRGGECEARPMLFWDAAHGNVPVPAVKLVVDVFVALHFFEVGQHVVPGPALGASLLPDLKIGRRATVRQLAVDRRSAAEDAGLLVLAEGRRTLMRVVVRNDLGANLEFGPVETRVEVSLARIAVENFLRHLAWRCVGAGFQQQHLVRRLGRQTVRENGACRSATHNDVVVNRHRSPVPP